MKAQETNLLKFLRTPAQYIIPVYQRTYSWEISQCQQLWRDILRAGKDIHASGHFMGSVVYIAKGIYSTSSVPQLLVIDGQQRLTTLALLLAALGRVLGDGDTDIGITPKKLASYYLFNDLESDDLRYKLLLTRSDKETLTHLLEGKEPPEKPSHRILENFRLFEDLLRRSPSDWEAVWEGIQKLMIVDISLDRDHDNPQLIFESLNATGLKLSQADLIRNYILMGLEPQEQKRLYEDYWFPMEREFGHAEYAERFDGFMRDYLTVKTGRISNLRDVYADFKALVKAKEDTRSLADVVADVYRFSRYYVRIALHKDPDPNLNCHFTDINTLRMEVAYPFLVEVYQDYEDHVITRDEFTKILSLVESYVFRRAICGIPTNSLNKTFAGLSREVRKDDYVDSFQAALLVKDSYRRFPRNDEFMREFVVKDVYNFRSRNYYLTKLENDGRKEPASVDSYTIEHILPQNPHLRPEWQAALGADWKGIQSRLLHTLGNLTLTGYNSEYSDRPFPQKRDMEGGFAHSPLLLNKGLGQLDTWGETEITQRADSLSQKAVTVWPCPALSPDALARCQPTLLADDATPYTLADHAEYLQGDILALFQEFRKRVLNLDSSVREEVKKLYIAYKNTTNFVDVIPQKRRLRLSLNMRFEEIDDPKGLCRDITDIGRWGNGDVDTGITSMDQMEDVMALVRQAFDKHMEDAD